MSGAPFIEKQARRQREKKAAGRAERRGRRKWRRYDVSREEAC